MTTEPMPLHDERRYRHRAYKLRTAAAERTAKKIRDEQVAEILAPHRERRVW